MEALWLKGLGLGCGSRILGYTLTWWPEWPLGGQPGLELYSLPGQCPREVQGAPGGVQGVLILTVQDSWSFRLCWPRS